MNVPGDSAKTSLLRLMLLPSKCGIPGQSELYTIVVGSLKCVSVFKVSLDAFLDNFSYYLCSRMKDANIPEVITFITKTQLPSVKIISQLPRDCISCRDQA